MILREFILAARALRRTPVFTLTAAVTLALGIGAATAIFSVTNGVLLRPLPYQDPGRLAVMYGDLHARQNFGMPFSNENFADIRNGTSAVFESLAGVNTFRQVLPREDGTPEQVRFAGVTSNFFQTVGARLALGRDFVEADGTPQAPPPQGVTPQPAAPPVANAAILSHEFWQRRFGGDRAVLGRALPGGPGAQVVGVLAPGVELLFPPVDNVERLPDVWVVNRIPYNNANRNGYFIRPVGRLRDGVPLARAQEAVDAVAATIRRDFSLYETARWAPRLEPMHKALVGEVRPAILALTGAVVFLLLIACANVANLLLVRASLRETELAVRSALGAGKWPLVRQILAEALLLTALGTIGGVALAWVGIRQLLAIAPANLPRLESIRIDPSVLAFSVASGLVAALLFGLVPAWSAFRVNLMNVLRGTSRTAGLRAAGLLRNAVVVAEVALCFVLLIGSGLMFRSFLALQRINPGFDPQGVLTFQLLGGRPGPAVQRGTSNLQLEERLRALPGVQNVTASFPFPLAGGFSTIRWGTEGALADQTRFQAVDWQVVLPGYFDAMRTPLLEGRTFTADDSTNRRSVVVVDQMLARKAYPGESAVGKRILIRIRTPEPEFVEVIGVVGHQRVNSIADPGREQVYFTDGFLGFGRTQRWAVRTGGDPAAPSDAVRAAIAAHDPLLLVNELQPMSALVEQSQSSTRFTLMLTAVFAAVATLLVCVGLYGVLSTVVRQRTAEIGVRLALGAEPRSILRLVVGHGLALSAAGIGVGLIAAFALTRLMTSMLVGVTPTDPLTFVAMAIVFCAIATVAAWLPAHRAATLDPVTALRDATA